MTIQANFLFLLNQINSTLCKYYVCTVCYCVDKGTESVTTSVTSWIAIAPPTIRLPLDSYKSPRDHNNIQSSWPEKLDSSKPESTKVCHLCKAQRG